MKYYPYFIQVLTNMHVGSGDANYGIVDKLIQRDPVTGFPTINASSLKGALREHFEEKSSELVDTIFGKESKSKDEPSEPGLATFLEADLVAIPVRSNFQRFVMALNKAQLEMLNKKAERLTGKDIFNTNFSPDNALDNALYHQQGSLTYDVYLEDIKIEKKNDYQNPLKNQDDKDLFHKRIAILLDEDFATVTQNLPVIARNHLENGISQNLWYEEVVPHQTVFLTFIGLPTDEEINQRKKAVEHKINELKGKLEMAKKDEKKKLEDLLTKLEKDLKWLEDLPKTINEFQEHLQQDIIQIGGNASIGYGLTKFYPVEIQDNTNNQNQEQ